MAYYFYRENTLQGPFSVSELRSQIQGDDLVKNETGTWMPAASLPKWNEVTVDVAQPDVIEPSSNEAETIDETEKLEPEAAAEEIIEQNAEHWLTWDEADERRKQAVPPVDFPFFKPQGIGHYFKYDNEYISGSTYLVRAVLQSILCKIGLGFYLQTINIYKRLRSITSKERAGLFTAMYTIAVVAIFGLGLDAYPSDTIELTLVLLVSAVVIFHCWLVFANSKNPMFGGVDAMIQKLEISDVGRLSDLQEVLRQEEFVRREQGIPDEVVVVPALHFAPGFMPNAYYLAVRDSKQFYPIHEFSTLGKGVKLLRKTPEFEEEYAAFKLRILNPKPLT